MPDVMPDNMEVRVFFGPLYCALLNVTVIVSLGATWVAAGFLTTIEKDREKGSEAVAICSPNAATMICPAVLLQTPVVANLGPDVEDVTGAVG